ncbi:MAG TPA: ChaN family lipoprotein [Flavobacterium sp.]|jgi:uncharacterized iron-regulated protein
MPIKFSLFFLLISVSVFAQDKLPYKIYTSKGKESSYTKMLREIQKAEVVLFGEHHDSSIIHWLELCVAEDVSATKPVILGAEMIEADNQQQLNRYLRGEIDQKQLDSLARLWPNYKTDYKPLVDFAKEHSLPFVATNVPRRFASMVYKGGFERLNVLTEEERSWVAPLPVAYDASLSGYQKIRAEMGGHGGENLPKAQALKDATMAHFILLNTKPLSVFIHYNGTYHSDNFEGIYWYLKRAEPALRIVTIATVAQKDLTFLKENYNKADFIIVTDEDVTKTY